MLHKVTLLQFAKKGRRLLETVEFERTCGVKSTSKEYVAFRRSCDSLPNFVDLATDSQKYCHVAEFW